MKFSLFVLPTVPGTLEDREQHVIRMRYGLDDGQPRTLDQIGRLAVGGVQDLQGDALADVDVFGFVDAPHGARSDQRFAPAR